VKIEISIEDVNKDDVLDVTERITSLLSDYRDEEETETVEFDEEVVAEMIKDKLLDEYNCDKPLGASLELESDDFIVHMALENFVEKILQLEDEVLDELFGDE
jgi:DNA integrity scanning protein DisA with diadenylate cyclase activity